MTSWIATLGAIAERRDRAERLELNEGSQLDAEEALDDVHRYNRLFGGALFIRRYVLPYINSSVASRPLMMLDLGCGAGQMARRVAKHGRRRAVALRVIALDSDRRSLIAARRLAVEGEAVSFVQADAEALPFLESSIDVAYSTLVLHHLDPAAAARTIRGLRSVCRHAVLINDLVRNRMAWCLFWFVSIFLAKNRISREDGLTSIRRSYNSDEVRSMFKRAGSTTMRLIEHPTFFRVTAIDELEQQ